MQSPLGQDSPFDRLNTLFSGLAFWGVVFAILLQKSELELQRRELRFTRSEVRGQKEQLQTQNITMKQQRFENTFFSLLGLLNSIVDSLEVAQVILPGRPTPSALNGRRCFSKFYSELRDCYANEKKEKIDWDLLSLCVSSYERFVISRQSYVGHYFRTLYNIVKFIDTSAVEDKQIYINLLRAQLSSIELNLLFYNCLSDYGNLKFKPLVERYGLLENMRRSDLIDQQHAKLYKETAFISQ
jgi:hypothetical protein